MKPLIVRLKGRNYRAVFDWSVFSTFADHENIKFGELSKLNNLSLKQYIRLIYFSLKEGARRVKQKFDFSPEDVGAAITRDNIFQMASLIKNMNTKTIKRK